MNMIENLAYKSAFKDAIQFTVAQGLGDQKRPLLTADVGVYQMARNVALDYLKAEAVPSINSQNLGGTDGNFWFFGSQCGNVHYNAQARIKRNFLGMTVHLTIGGVDAVGASAFPYTQADFARDKANRPNKIRGHVWLTFGGEYIVDLTLGTWLANTKPFTHYGSIISGLAGALSFEEFPIKPCVLKKSTLVYTPVAVENQALFAIAPLA